MRISKVLSKVRPSLTALAWFMFVLVPSSVAAESYFPFRGDQGPLKEFQPQAAVWLSQDRLLVTDSRFNNLQIFDTEGRRFRIFDAATNHAPAQFVGLTGYDKDEYLILGSHYHEKNHPRYRDQRSRFHKFRFYAEKEDLILDDLRHNLSPQEPLRRTRMWGATPTRQLQFAGFAINRNKDIAWFGLGKPLSEKGNIALLRCSLKGLLAQDQELKFTEEDTGIHQPIEKRSSEPMYLTDIEVLDDGSLLLLLTADQLEGKRLCTNSLWHWTPGGKAVPVKEELAPENRATGMAVHSLGDGTYRVALVCDNLTEQTGIPSRLVIFDSPLKF